MLTWPKAADTVCNQVEILIYMEWPFFPSSPAPSRTHTLPKADPDVIMAVNGLQQQQHQQQQQ